LQGALQGVDRGQWLVSQGLEVRHIQILRQVVGPQVVRLALPRLSNSLIRLVKDMSLEKRLARVQRDRHLKYKT
jgi:cystine transport system permease protein